MTATDFVTLRRIERLASSADHRWLVWQQDEVDLAANGVKSSLWLLDLRKRKAEPKPVPLSTGMNARDPMLSPDGQWVYFIGDGSARDQVWRIRSTGGSTEQITDYSFDVSGYLLSPTGQSVAIWGQVSTSCNELPCEVPQPASDCCGSGRVFDRLPVRQAGSWTGITGHSLIYARDWQTWMRAENRQRIYVVPVATGKGKSVHGRLIGDASAAPGEVSWGRDGQKLYFTFRESNQSAATASNDIFAAPIATAGEPVNLTHSKDDIEKLPAVSPDGQWLAYVASAQCGGPMGSALYLRNIRTEAVRRLAPEWSTQIVSLTWSANSKSVLVTTRNGIDEPLFRVTLADGEVMRLTDAGHVSGVVPMPAGSAIIALDTMVRPAELYHLMGGGRLKRLTDVNADRVDDVEMLRFERYSFTGAQGVAMTGWMVAPRGVVAKLPTVLVVYDRSHTTAVSNWSSHWNPAVLAASGYAVVGVEFQESLEDGRTPGERIQPGRSSQNLEDLKRGLTGAATAFPVVNPAAACVIGIGARAGYVASWIETRWADELKCMVVHAGGLDEGDQSLRGEGRHPNSAFEHPGEYGQASAVEQTTSWRTPLLLLHGEQDFRVPYMQSVNAFIAAQSRNVPSRLVVFPDEGHSIVRPKNRLQWYGEVLSWLRDWLGAASASS